MDNVLEMVLRLKDEATATLKDAGNEITKTKDKVADMSKTFLLAGGIMTGAGIAGVSAMKSWIDAASAASQETARTNVSLVATAEAMKLNRVETQKLIETAKGLGDAYIDLGFDDEETANSFAKLVSVTKDVDEAQKALAASADLARFKNIGLAEASQAVQMAMLGNTKILKQLGIDVKDQAKGFDVLAAVQGKVKGQADAFANSYEGAMQRMQVSMANVKEALGMELLAPIAEVVDNVATFVRQISEADPKFFQMAVRFTAIGTAVSLVGGALLIFIGMLPALTAGIGIFTSTVLPAVGIAAALGVAGTLIVANWSKVQPMLQPVFDFLVRVFNQIKAQITEFVVAILPSLELRWQQISTNVANALVVLQNIWNAAFPSMVAMAQSAWDMITGIVQIGWGIVETVLSVGLALVTGDWQKAWEGMKKGFEDIWNGIVKFLTGTWNTIVNIFKTQINSIIGMLNGFIDIVNKAGGKGNGGGIPKLQSLQSGGYVDMTGAAYLHQGEFVLSRGMLNGDRNMPSEVRNNFSQPITLNVQAYTPVDYDLISTRIAWLLRNSR